MKKQDFKKRYGITERQFKGVDEIGGYLDLGNLTSIPEGFEDFQLKSLQAVIDLVKSRGGTAYMDNDLDRTCRVLNYSFKV